MSGAVASGRPSVFKRKYEALSRVSSRVRENPLRGPLRIQEPKLGKTHLVVKGEWFEAWSLSVYRGFLRQETLLHINSLPRCNNGHQLPVREP